MVSVTTLGLTRAIMPDIIYCLMEDGTVEYVNTDKVLNKLELKSSGKVADLKNVVRIEPVLVGDSSSGSKALAAIMTDGSSYIIKYDYKM